MNIFIPYEVAHRFLVRFKKLETNFLAQVYTFKYFQNYQTVSRRNFDPHDKVGQLLIKFISADADALGRCKDYLLQMKLIKLLFPQALSSLT